MTEFETFEISITSLDGKYQFLSSSLQNVGINETYQSLFDRLIEPFVFAPKDDVIANNSSPVSNNSKSNDHDSPKKSAILSPASSSSSPTSSSDHYKLDKLDIKTIECRCYSNLNSPQGSGCNVALQFNIHSISKRHKFLRIIYQIDVPHSSVTDPVINTSPISSKQLQQLQQPRKYSKFHELASHLKKSRCKHSKSHMKYKVYKPQESLLTLLFVVPEFKSMYFIFLAGFLLFFTSVVIDDFIKGGEVFQSLSLFEWNFKYYNQLITTWIYMISYQFALVLLFYFYRHSMYLFAIIPRSKTYCNDYVYVICYALYMIPLMIYPTLWAAQFNIAGSLIVSCEQTRFILKSHAFFVETFKTKLYYDKHQSVEAKHKKDDDDDDEKLHENGVQYETKNVRERNEDIPAWLVDIDMNLADFVINFGYFLFIPMLVYRTKYPRTKEIRWKKVFMHLRDVLLSICSVWVTFCRFCIPTYRKSVSDPGTFATLFSEFINGSLPGLMLLLLGFFGFLHSWLNAFAELLRFGDRQFYQDWWNARSFAQYYRKWNCVVHDWIYNYLYLPLIEAGYSKTFAMAIVFGTSSVIHEYILFVGCKFFYPVLLFMFGGLGVFFVPLTRLWRNAKGWNIFLWSMLLIGQGILLVLYSREWYATHLDKNDIVSQFIDQHSWMPNSLQLFIKRDEILALSGDSS